MSKKRPRFKLGLDVWECPDCKTVMPMGAKCKCGKCYADVLVSASQQKQIEHAPMPNKTPRKKYTPKSRSGFLDSYL